MYYVFLADGNGTDSVQFILDSHPKEMEVMAVVNYEMWEWRISNLIDEINPNDTVVLDSITMLAETTRGDLKIGNDYTISYWNERAKLIGEKNFGADYSAAMQMILRRLKNLQNKGAKLIVTAHEKEREDPTTMPPTKKRGPDVNDQFLSSLRASSSDLARLRVVYGDEVINEKTTLKKGQRVLEFGPSDDYMSKCQVSLEKSGKVPSIITRPSYSKVCKALEKTPTWLTIYGPPGAGKSTFALSALIDPEGEGIGV